MGIAQLGTDFNVLVKIGFAVGLGLIILGKFQNVSGITTTANTAVANIVGGLDDIADWMGIIVLVIVGTLLYAKMGGQGGMG